MNKNKVGKGKKADYQTTVVRVPVDIKNEVDTLVNQFHANRCPKSVTNIIQVNANVVIALAKIDGEALCTKCYLDFRSVLDFVESFSGWKGNDFEECLDFVNEQKR